LVLAGLQEKWRPLRTQLFPKLVMVDLSEQLVIGQPVKRGKPLAPIWSAPIPARTCRDGVPQLIDAVGDFLGDLLLEYGGIDAQLVVSLPRQASHWRVVDWPAGQQPVDSSDALRALNPDLGWPFSLGAAYLDVHALPGRPASSLVIAAERSVVDAWVEVFAIAGGTLQHLLPSQVCLMWGLRDALAATPAGTVVVLLQPLDQQTSLILWHQGVPAFERMLPGPMVELIPALQQSLEFYKTLRAPQAPVRLLLPAPLEDQALLEQALALEVELVDHAGFGSLALQGLATLELVQ
jgi:Tfp pilus assembly PilM family ATPase